MRGGRNSTHKKMRAIGGNIMDRERAVRCPVAPRWVQTVTVWGTRFVDEAVGLPSYHWWKQVKGFVADSLCDGWHWYGGGFGYQHLACCGRRDLWFGRGAQVVKHKKAWGFWCSASSVLCCTFVKRGPWLVGWLSLTWCWWCPPSLVNESVTCRGYELHQHACEKYRQIR